MNQGQASNLPHGATGNVCELCSQVLSDATSLVWSDHHLRVVRVLDAPAFPAFYRIVWAEHVAELSGLDAVGLAACMRAVVTVEKVLIESLRPTKVNLASLGNMVPHLHWHVIARFTWDSHFPQPIWGSQQRVPAPAAGQRMLVPLNEVDRRLAVALSAG